MGKFIDLSSSDKFCDPFSYVVLRHPFTHEVSLQILEWLESEDSWRFKETEFYQQYEFSLSDVYLPKHLFFLRNTACLCVLKRKFESLFGVTLIDQIDIVAHKLLSGHRIRIHNDFIPGHETHRFTVQLNRGLEDDWGGWFILFDSSDPTDIHKIFRPIHNTGLGFAISERSYHAVSPLSGGERYTLVFSFYEDHTEKPVD